jgi:hypothetical protein
MTGDTAPVAYWSMVEVSLSIITICLPTLRPLFRWKATIEARSNIDERTDAMSHHRSTIPMTSPSLDSRHTVDEVTENMELEERDGSIRSETMVNTSKRTT